VATARELLQQELTRRAAQDQLDQGAIREDIGEQEAIANIDPSFRQSLGTQAAFVDELTGSNLAPSIRRDDPESVQDSLRNAFKARQSTPKQNLLGFLQTQLGQERADQNSIDDLAIARLKGSGKAELSGEGRKRLGSTRLALNALDDMEAALDKGNSILPEFITGPTGDNLLTEARRRFVEGFGRGQSGAAIGDAERANFAKMAPRFSDSPEIREMKFRSLRSELENRVRELGADPRNLNNSPSPEQPQSSGFGGDGSFDPSSATDEELMAIIKGGK